MSITQIRIILRQELRALLEPIFATLKAKEEFHGKRFLKATEAMEFLSISKSTFYKWLREGKIKRVYINGLPRYNKQDLINLR